MVNAYELYNFCCKYNYGRGLVRYWSIKHFEVLVNSLQPNETIKLCFIGLHNYSSIVEHRGCYAYAITNKRIIMAHKRIFGEDVETVVLDNINAISLKAKLVIGVISVDTLKGIFNVANLTKTSENINNRIHDLLLELQSQKRQPYKNQSTDADELLKYKQLLDKGIITKEEFEHKKKQLLN